MFVRSYIREVTIIINVRHNVTEASIWIWFGLSLWMNSKYFEYGIIDTQTYRTLILFWYQGLTKCISKYLVWYISRSFLCTVWSKSDLHYGITCWFHGIIIVINIIVAIFKGNHETDKISLLPWYHYYYVFNNTWFDYNITKFHCL